MMSLKLVTAVAAGAAIAAGMFLLGRETAPSPRPIVQIGSYFHGLRAGEVQGRAEGRALQEGSELPRGQRNATGQAFKDGYVAGMNDVFAGYDGGWAMHVPWIVTLGGGPGQVVYRILDREQVEPGIDYYLCADGHSVCHARRH
jgi:hypothetical protein